LIETLGEMQKVDKRRHLSAAHRRSIYLPVLALAITARIASAQVIPIQASDGLVTEDGDLQYSLTNSASQPATAWTVTLMATDPNGQVVRHIAITTDEYRAEADRGMVPDEELNRSLLRPHAFADGTAVGPVPVIESIFQRRIAERNAKHEILRQLRDVQTHYVGIEALKEAAARLRRSMTADDPGNAYQIVLQNLRAALTHSRTDGFEASRELAHQVDLVRREYRVAVQHSVPRKEN
jgi:hypothetical protein